MPTTSPKQHKDKDDPTRPRAVYHNRRRIKRVIVGTTVLTIAIMVIGWSLVATWPDVRKEDTVRIRYSVWTSDGTFIEGSDDLTVYVDTSLSPHIIYFEISHAKLGVLQNFVVSACPSHDCLDYDGYFTGTYAWQALKGNVTVLEILNR